MGLQYTRVRKASEASDDNENESGPVTHDFNLLSAETKTDADQDENASRTLERSAARVKGESPNSPRVGEIPTRRLIGRGNDLPREEARKVRMWRHPFPTSLSGRSLPASCPMPIQLGRRTLAEWSFFDGRTAEDTGRRARIGG